VSLVLNSFNHPKKVPIAGNRDKDCRGLLL